MKIKKQVIKKILIANRSEIALRIIKTAHRMHIKCVAIYSNSDSQSLHVSAADESWPLHADSAKESYLHIKKIIQIAKDSHCDAIHPGYGFLAENADFAAACKKAGIIFIGPQAKTIALMGDKATAKSFAKEKNIPVIPGEENLRQDLASVKKAAKKIGFPLLLKASAGGGGKGMKLVRDMKEIDNAFHSAKREALASFGDDTLLLEKYFDKARHIEIQVLADQHKNVLHLFDRDCSLQRRHQKVVEEAPAFGLSEGCRKAMQACAIALCQSIDYQGAGTLEFLLDENENFYLMEMNTRLQVEHAVTEQITGIDIVEQQILIAQGEPLKLKQEDIAINGHSIEVRLYAEQCKNNFLPASGIIDALVLPDENASIRIDHALLENQHITPLYDPMIAKVACHGKDRKTAIQNLDNALSQCFFIGAENNRNFLLACLRHKDFLNCKISTKFIENNLDALLQDDAATLQKLARLAADLFNQANKQLNHATAEQLRQSYSPWFNSNNWRLNHEADFSYTITINEKSFKNSTQHQKEALSISKIIRSDGASLLGSWQLADDTAPLSGLFKLKVQNSDALATLFISCQAGDYTLLVQNEQTGKLKQSHAVQNKSYQAPLNGRVIAVNVKKGDKVSKDQEVIVIEAMKMEHIIKARENGRIEQVFVSKDQQVEGSQPLFTLAS